MRVFAGDLPNVARQILSSASVIIRRLIMPPMLGPTMTMSLLAGNACLAWIGVATGITEDPELIVFADRQVLHQAVLHQSLGGRGPRWNGVSWLV